MNQDGRLTGIEQLNDENEATRFDEALTGYFRVAAVSRKRQRGRGGRGMRLHTEEEPAMSPEGCLKQLKQILRDASQSQPRYVNRIFDNILYQLRRASSAKTSPAVFNRAIQLCREIFQRSVAFRALIAAQTATFFDQLLAAAGDDPRANVSRALRAQNRKSPNVVTVLELIETWKQDFGAKYPAIVAGHAVLMERGYTFPRARERQQQARQQAVDIRRHRDRVCDAKKQQRDREMTQFVPEMEQVLVEMNRIFEILVPTLDTFDIGSQSPTATETNVVGDPAEQEAKSEKGDGEDVEWEDAAPPATASAQDEDDDVEWETVSGDNNNEDQQESPIDELQDQMDINDIVQAYGLGSSSYQLTVEVPKRVCEESADNDVLFRNLKDSALRMQKRFLPLLDDWEQHSTLPARSSTNSAALQLQREILQQIRDLRDRMARALLKWEDLVHDKQQKTATPSAVVTLPLDAYDPPRKRRRG